jgi:hypothetical protein
MDLHQYYQKRFSMELGVLIGRLEVNHLFSHNAIEEYDYILSCLFSVYLDVK